MIPRQQIFWFGLVVFVIVLIIKVDLPIPLFSIMSQYRLKVQRWTDNIAGFLCEAPIDIKIDVEIKVG